MSWSISVRTVGGGDNGNTSSGGETDNNTASTATAAATTATDGGAAAKSIKSNVSNFTVQVEPDDFLSSLHEKIEGVTGLTASQQRLIYRGRIISSGNGAAGGTTSGTATPNSTTAPSSSSTSSSSGGVVGKEESRIRDVDGLCDGQTIHLVPRPVDPSSTPSSSSGNNATAGGDNADTIGGTGSTSGSGGASLLAALLGLGGGFSLGSTDDDDDDDGDTSNNPSTDFGRFASFSAASNGRRSLQRGARGGLSSSRRRGRDTYSARLTEADLQVPDPGTLEPVRQGLLTLHTMLHNTNQPLTQTQRQSLQQQSSSPLEANRRWFRGQWLDCRDTVNQWLEATIIDIVNPEDILPSNQIRLQSFNEDDDEQNNDNSNSNTRPRQPASDPAVGANDIIGRRRLLLQPRSRYANNITPPTHSTTPSALTEEEDDEFDRYCPRDNNEGVQLLLVHYNGWPHRWDEWIRSDSERIRPFRTRTRHRASAFNASPTPQSIFQAAPNTFISNRNDLNNPNNNNNDEIENDDLERAAMLPELSRTLSAVNELLLDALDTSDEREGGIRRSASTVSITSPSHLPWLTQSEEAPAIAQQDSSVVGREELSQTVSVATDNQRINQNNSSRRNRKYDRKKLEALTPLIDRLGRTLTDAAPHIAALAASLPENENDEENEENAEEVQEEEDNEARSSEETAATASRLFWRSSRTSNNDNDNVSATTPLLSSRSEDNEQEEEEEEEEDRSNDPDYVDFINGMVNVSRSEGSGARTASRFGGGGRNRGGDGDGGLGTSLLATYLAAAGLGSLGGNNNNGGNNGNGNNNNGDNNNSNDGDNNGGIGQLVRIGGTDGGGGGGGGNGPGIDIHIHAIVTGPNMAGVTPGALGLATMGGGGAAGGGGAGTAAAAAALSEALGGGGNGGATRNTTGMGSSDNNNFNTTDSISNSVTAANDNAHHDDDGLFSELYSEDPTAINLHGSSHVSEEDDAVMGDNNDSNENDVDEDMESLDDLPPLMRRRQDSSSSDEGDDDEEENFKNASEEVEKDVNDDEEEENDDVPPLIDDSVIASLGNNSRDISGNTATADLEATSATNAAAASTTSNIRPTNTSSGRASNPRELPSSSSRRGSSFSRILRRALGGGSRRSSSSSSFGDGNAR